MPEKTDLKKNFIVVTTKRGEDLKIHPVPMHIINGIVPPVPKPKRPWIEMETKTGKQRRPAKDGDPEWEDFQEEMEAWNQLKSDLEDDVSLVMALREYPIPEKIEYSDEIELLIEMKMLPEPANEFSEKALWLRDNVVGQHDEHMINLAIQRLAGVPDEVVDQMESNFRDILLGKISRVVEAAVEEEESD